jgi:large subunit ribosomal protein L21
MILSEASRCSKTRLCAALSDTVRVITPERTALGLIFVISARFFDKKAIRRYNCVPLIEMRWGVRVYAVVKMGGKQYRVAVGDRIDVEKLPNVVGERVTLADVLMVERDGQVSTGKPMVAGAQVIATVVGEGKGKKTIHFDYRSKHRRRKTIGHRQQFTRLEISEIRV